MTRPSVRLSLCWCTLSLLLAGCATDRSQSSASLLSQLKGEPKNVQQASYQADSDDQLGSKKIKDPLALKLQYAHVMEQFENFPDAHANYSEVLASEPENFEAVIGLARVEQAIGDHQKAGIGFRKAHALKPDSAVAQHALGQFHLAQGRVAEALPLLNKAVLSQPNDKSYRYDLAVALAQSGDVNAALQHFKRTVGEAPAHHNIATVLREMGNLQAAEQHYRQALSIQPELEESRRALVALYDQRETRQQYAQHTRGGSAVQGAPNRSVVPASHEAPAQLSPALEPSPRPASRQTAARPASHTTPNRPTSSDASERPAMSPHTTTAPSQPLTPAQIEQRRNQRSLTR